jgi:PmbA protein
MLSADDLLDTLERALAATGGDVELSAQSARIGTTRFANSRVTQTGDVEERIIQARVSFGGRVGAARTNAIDAASLAQVIADARAVAESQPRGRFPGFAGGSEPLAGSASFDEPTAQASADHRAALVSPAFEAAARAGMTAAGLAAVATNVYAVATSAGCRRVARTTSARLDVIVAGGDASARLGACHHQISAIDAVALAAETSERAQRTRTPIALPEGTYDVILEPPAVAEILEWLALTSLGARSLEDGSSCLAGRAGEAITGPISLYDDALAGEDGCPTLPFDAEGTPRRRVVFLDAGKAGAVTHDRTTAALLNAASTGHAPPIADELFESGPLPQHLHLGAGSDDAQGLLRKLGRGLLVSRFHYVNGLLDTRRALMTGMTRDGLFLVENGAPVSPVRNLRWTVPVLEAFARIDGITRSRQVIGAGLSDAVMVAPTVLVRGWTFSG